MVTRTLEDWTVPSEFVARHLYWPRFSGITFSITKKGRFCPIKTCPSLNHSILGCGAPVTIQVKLIRLPSVTF